MAARIAALAEGGQVLSSAETAGGAAGTHAISEPRSVALKGLSAEIDVVSVAWT